jgi:hypothetical protein
LDPAKEAAAADRGDGVLLIGVLAITIGALSYGAIVVLIG